MMTEDLGRQSRKAEIIGALSWVVVMIYLAALAGFTATFNWLLS